MGNQITVPIRLIYYIYEKKYGQCTLHVLIVNTYKAQVNMGNAYRSGYHFMPLLNPFPTFPSWTPLVSFVNPSVLYNAIIPFIVHCFAGLVVPDVPLEETEVLRKEAAKNGIELVCLPLSSSILFIVYSLWMNSFLFQVFLVPLCVVWHRRW